MRQDGVIVSKKHNLSLRLVTAAMCGHLWRRLWWMIVLVCVGSAALAAWEVSAGRPSWFVFAALVFVYPAVLFLVAARYAAKGMRLFKIPRILRFSDEGIETSDALGNTGNVVWPVFEFARRTRDLWLLYMSTGMFVMIPLDAFEPEDRPGLDALIRSKVAVK